MSKILIGSVSLEDHISTQSEQIKILGNRVVQLEKQTAEFNTLIIQLQTQLIDVQKRETSERKSLWEFLTTRGDKPLDKSRITETIVDLGK